MAKVTNAELKTLWQTNTTTTNKNFKKAKKAIDGKVDKVTGKGLSTEDFTTAEKTKLGALPTNADLQSAIDAKTTLSAVQELGFQTATQVATAIANAEHLKREVVASLPAVASADAHTIYMVAKASAKNGNAYDEYMLINGAFEKIGDTEIDISNCVQTEDIADMATKTWVVNQNYLTAHQDITGKQDIIDSSHKLSADLVDDSSATHKFVTSAQLTAIGTIGNKVEAQDVTDTINEIFGSLSITAWDSIDISE